VAFARAVVLEPEVLLLDEPMAALDLKLRKEMQVELKNLQERLRVTFVFVTHDQEEALLMSDRIAVMSRGRIEQLGAPDALYERPRTRFVADFLGVKNVLEAEVASVEGGVARLHTRGGLQILAADDGGYRPGTAVAIGVRPERLRLDGTEPAGESGPLNRLAGILDDELYLGDRTDWRINLGGETVTVAEGAAARRERRRGDAVTVVLPGTAVLRLEGE